VAQPSVVIIIIIMLHHSLSTIGPAPCEGGACMHACRMVLKNTTISCKIGHTPEIQPAQQSPVISMCQGCARHP